MHSRLLLALTLVALLACRTAAALDSDADGVEDGLDACPDSPRASRDHVDAHGCTHLQIDADLDGWCNPDRPRDANNRWRETKDEWCVGVDNCKFVPNPDQAITVPDATHGDACNPGMARSCVCECLFLCADCVLYCNVLESVLPASLRRLLVMRHCCMRVRRGGGNNWLHALLAQCTGSAELVANPAFSTLLRFLYTDMVVSV
jgi:hypothetical protein